MLRTTLRLALLLPVSCAAPSSPSGSLVHTVYFSLRDPQDAAALADACRERLASFPGLRHVDVGRREESQARPVNVRDFDVTLTLVFRDLPSLEGYLVHPAHLALVEEFTPRLTGVRVYDSRTGR